MSLEQAINKILQDPECINFYEWTKAIQVDASFSLEHFTWERFRYWNELIEQLKKDNQYAKFDNKMQHVGFGAYRVRIEDVANWLLRKSKQTNAQNAIEILHNYNTSKTITLYVIMTLMSIRTSLQEEYTFSNGVKLFNESNIGKINKKLSQDMLHDNILSSIPTPHISSVFAFPVEKDILHTDDTYKIEAKQDEEYNIALEKINNVKDCLILSRGLGGVHSMAHKYLIPDNIPLVSTARGSAWSFETFYLPTHSSPIITVDELTEANRILELYQSLDEKIRKSIHVSIERLNGYCSSSNTIERAVNIRTCLESVFLKENELSEIANTLALRASRLVEQTVEARKEKHKLIKDCYSLTSKAVHRGNISDKKMKNITKLDEVAELARKVIILKIENGKEFDWKEIELN